MDDKKKLEDLRGLLVEIDRDILRAIERRAKVAQDIAKLRTGTARVAPTADGPHIQALEKAVTPPFPSSAVRPIFTAIDSACRMFDVAPRVMYVGPERDFGWIAAHGHFGDGAELARADSTSAAAIEEVARSRAEYAVVPYESLKEGVIYPTVQAIAGSDLKLIGEREITQVLVLVGQPGEIADIERIFVSPQDHVACLGYLESSHPKAPVVDVRSPVAALERALQEPRSAAIVPRGCPAPDGLSVVRENIGDEGELRIRYGVVSRLPAPRSGHDVTAMLFTLRERPGALHDLLTHFKDRSCNLRRIQSFPVPGEGWEYIFYIEVSGHITDRPLVSALEGAKQEAKTLKILGSFPLERPEASHQASSGV
ncbi:MAG: chorismate mutase [Polyangiaceae bacterium]|nr:chorismate mutase [Polyangiaceae bacterium]